jgi:hypothetical protein
MNDPAPAKPESLPLPLFRLPTGAVINLRWVTMLGRIRDSDAKHPRSYFRISLLGVDSPIEMDATQTSSLVEVRDELLAAWCGVVGGTR